MILFPKFLKPYFLKKEELIRLGSIDDGGYVLPLKDIKNTDVLISLGISDNWDFEKDFSKISHAKILAYDHSIDLNFWILKFKKDLIKFFKLKIFKPKKIYKMIQYVDFLFFFRFKKKNQFFLKKIGNTKECVNIKKIISGHINENDKIFLKIDIEGSEYEILDQIVSIKDKIQGLVIEFHNVSKNLHIIENFLKKIEDYLNLVHIHANNYSVKEANQFPEALELSISSINLKNLDLDDFREYPIRDLDFPNSKRSLDIKFDFEIN
tara:strand:+ start:384 stop:1181 length:798 start_codon:yes stop_codon:yes gene_type:complete